MAHWHELYEATRLATNPTQLEQQIKETEDAIFLRVRELAERSDSAKERRQMAQASATLWNLKTQKLRWTDRKAKSA
jgi:hypothetical protein